MENQINNACVDAINEINASKYEQTVMITVYGDKQQESSVRDFCERFYQLFDKYNIQHSNAYVQYDPYSTEYGRKSSEMLAEYHNKFVYINKKDEPYCESIDFNIDHDIWIYIMNPKFADVREMLKFMVDFKEIVDSTTILDVDNVVYGNKAYKLYCEPDDDTDELFISYDEFRKKKKNSFDDIMGLIKWFFGPATAEKFKKNLLEEDIPDWYVPVADDKPFGRL